MSDIHYAPQNAVKSETYGNSLIHAVEFNNRLQPTYIKLGTSSNATSILQLSYTYSDTSRPNNGDVLNVSYSGGGLSYTQSFEYDELNRLKTAIEKTGSTTNWSQNNRYDQYGNRQIDYGGGSYNLTFSATTNQITSSGYTYESSGNGNLINDGVHAYGFDAENKVATVDSTAAVYTYDGEGHRVKKVVSSGGENTRFIYGIGGQLVAEYNGSSGNLKKEYISGITIEPTAVNSNGTQYPTGDHLGSPRVITNSSAAIVSRHDYQPFGEELSTGIGGRTTGIGFGAGSGDNNRKKFTGYERDTETGLDFAQARFYASTHGRFTSPDPFSGSAIIANPQTFNRYAYVGNNPVNSTDPTGMAALGAKFSMSYGDGREMAGASKGYGQWEQADADIDREFHCLGETFESIEQNRPNDQVVDKNGNAQDPRKKAAEASQPNAKTQDIPGPGERRMSEIQTDAIRGDMATMLNDSTCSAFLTGLFAKVTEEHPHIKAAPGMILGTFDTIRKQGGFWFVSNVPGNRVSPNGGLSMGAIASKNAKVLIGDASFHSKFMSAESLRIDQAMSGLHETIHQVGGTVDDTTLSHALASIHKVNPNPYVSPYNGSHSFYWNFALESTCGQALRNAIRRK